MHVSVILAVTFFRWKVSSDLCATGRFDMSKERTLHLVMLVNVASKFVFSEVNLQSFAIVTKCNRCSSIQLRLCFRGVDLVRSLGQLGILVNPTTVRPKGELRRCICLLIQVGRKVAYRLQQLRMLARVQDKPNQVGHMLRAKLLCQAIGHDGHLLTFSQLNGFSGNRNDFAINLHQLNIQTTFLFDESLKDLTLVGQHADRMKPLHNHSARI